MKKKKHKQWKIAEKSRKRTEHDKRVKERLNDGVREPNFIDPYLIKQNEWVINGFFKRLRYAKKY